MVEHRHEVGSGRRGEPVRHEDAGAAGEQAVGGHHDEALGHRVHPGGGLVEHDDGDVAHEEPGKGDELLLARRERGAPGAERGVEAVGQAVDPVVEAEFGDGGAHRRGGHVGEEGDVLGEGPGEDVGALGDDADGRTQCVDVEVAHVDATEEDRPPGRVGGARQQRGQRGLARPGSPDEGARPAGGDVEADAVQGEVPLGVGEVQVPELDPDVPGRNRPTALGLRWRLEQLPQARDGPDAGLQLGQVAGHLVDLPDERARDEEQGDQAGHRQVVADDQCHPCDARAREQRVEQEAGAPGGAGLQRQQLVEPAVHGCRQGAEALHDVGLAQAGAQVVSGGDPLLEGCGMVGPGGLFDDGPLRDGREQPADDGERGRPSDREEDPGRPPGQTSDDPHGDGGEHGAQGVPHLAAQHRAHGVGVVIDPVEHLPHRLLTERRQRLVKRGIHEILAQATLRAVDHRGPQRAARSVEDGGTDDAQRQETDEPGGRVGREQPGHDGAQSASDRPDRGCRERHARGPCAQARETHLSAGRAGR